MTEPRPNNQPIRVLLVADSESEINTLEVLLSKCRPGSGATLDWVATDSDARTAASKGYDICILAAPADLSVTKGFLRWAEPDLPPVILLTDGAGKWDAEDAIEAGAADALRRDELSAPLLEATMRFAMSRRQAEKRLARLALHDPVTGLPNQMLVWEMLDHGLSRAKRNKTNLGLLMIYVEGIGEINEAYGRAEGDQAMAVVARRLQSLLRATDTVGRFGGTKLVVILETVSHPEDLQLVSEKIVGSLSKPVAVGDTLEQLSCSIGIALFPWTTSSAESLIRRAAEAMDTVQEQGGNSFLYG